MEESEHLGSGDTKGPFLAFSHAGTNVQAGAHIGVETPRDITITFVE